MQEQSAYFNENDSSTVSVLHRCHMIEMYSVPCVVRRSTQDGKKIPQKEQLYNVKLNNLIEQVKRDVN